MATSFFSDDDKAAIEEIFDDVHETFKKKIYAFVEKVTYSSFNSDHNPLYGRNDNEAKGLTTRTKHTIWARVHYERWNSDDVDNDTNLPTSENIVRLKVSPADYETLKKAALIEVDGDNYSLITDDEKVGPFTVNYSQVYLRRNT